MKWICSFFVVIFALLCLAEAHLRPPRFFRYTVTGDALKYRYETKYFEQKIDHFGFPSPGTYRMRYLVNDDHWNKTGPIFFYTGNEGDVTAFAENTGFMWDIAPEFGALIVFAEHRYYGLSMPFGKDSYKRENLRYFTSEQALADYAVLLGNLNPENRIPVVLFGGSYGGMLAAWMRMKYPHLVSGAIAGSAPIWQFPGLTPCGVFNRIVSRDFVSANQHCATNIRKSWSVITALGSTAAGRRQLTESMKLCSPVKTADDLKKAKVWLLNVYGNLAMVNYPYQTSFLEPLPAWPVKEFCKHLSQDYDHVELVGHLTQGLRVYFNFTGQTKCFNTSSLDAGGLDDLGWDYQSCTEMVMPMCANGVDDMFEPYSWNFTEFSAECQTKWGVTPDPSWVKTHYGDRHIGASSNIVFSNGDLDPWSGGGVLKTINPSLPAVLIPEAAHHLDLRGSNPSDTDYIRRARAQHKKYIHQWIKEHRNGGQTPDMTFRYI